MHLFMVPFLCFKNAVFLLLPLGGITHSSSFVDTKGGLAMFSARLSHLRGAGSHGVLKAGKIWVSPSVAAFRLSLCLGFLICGCRAQGYGMSMAELDSDPGLPAPSPARSGHTPLLTYIHSCHPYPSWGEVSEIRNGWASLVTQLVKNLPATQEILVGFLRQEVLLEKR